MGCFASLYLKVPAIKNNASFENRGCGAGESRARQRRTPGRGLPTIIGKSAALRAYSTWYGSWPRPTPRVDHGETGTGKELIAEAISQSATDRRPVSEGELRRNSCWFAGKRAVRHEAWAYTGAGTRVSGGSSGG